MIGYSKKQIRHELYSVLTGVTSVGRVSKHTHIPAQKLPNLTYAFYEDDLHEDSAYMSYGKTFDRELRIVVEARALLVSGGTDSPIDDLCLEVEKAIATATTLNQWVNHLRLDSTDYQYDEEGHALGLASLEYVGFYSEAQSVSISNVVVTPASTSVNITFGTDIAGKAQVVLLSSGQDYVYSDVESGSIKSHDIAVSGLTPLNLYVMFYKIDSDPIGVSIIDGPEEGNSDNTLTDGVSLVFFMTTA